MPSVHPWVFNARSRLASDSGSSGIITTFVLHLVITFSSSHEDNMTTIRQLIQTGPAKANELLAKLVDTSDTAVKTRERLFADLKAELELLATLEEEHLFPVLRKHKETKSLVSEALNDNKQTQKLIAELERAMTDFG
jgi:hypothetical protein